MKKGLLSALSILFLFSIVIVVVVLMSVFLTINVLWILLVLWLIGVLWAVVVAFGKRRPDVKLRWIMFLIFVPIIGLFSYIFFGRPYHLSINKGYQYTQFEGVDEKTVDELALKLLETKAPDFVNTFKVSSQTQGDLIFQNSSVELLNNAAEAWIKIFQDLDQAQEYILINYYIVDDGELYRNLKKLLIKKAKEGVRIYFIYDFVGSFTKLSVKEQGDLKKAGISLFAYMPMVLPFLNWKSNYRDHRKDISIDGKIGYFGGSNIADEYINKSSKFGLWNDEQVRVTGMAVQGIEKIFANDWKFVSKKDLTTLEPTVGHSQVPVTTDESALVQIVGSGPNHKINTHYDIIKKSIAVAKKRIWLSSPYFVIPDELIEDLRIASLSGVDVRLVLPGLTDKGMILDISEHYADKLFDAGVKVYSMNETFNHTKAYLFDDDISFVGTTNLDYRAFFADQQTMCLVCDQKLSKQLESRFNYEFSVSTLNTTPFSKKKSGFKNFSTILLGWASPLL